MEYYYTSSNHQDYPLNYPYNNQPYNDYHHNYYYSSWSFDESKSNTPGIPLKLNYEFPSYDEYGGYSNEPPIRYDQNYDNFTQFHSNPYEHFPAQSLVVYQYNSSYDHHPLELPAKKGSNFLDPVSTTGFVISYSNTEPKPDLEFEEFDLRNFHGGYSIEETYGKPLPPSEEICYPPSKFDPTPPPPPSAFGGGEKNLNKTPELKEEEDQASEPEEDDDDEEEEEEAEEEEHEEENRGVLIAPLPRMGDQAVNEEEEEEEDDDDDDDDDDEEEEENRGVLVAPPLLKKEDQGVNEAEEEEEESSNSEGYEEREEEEEEKRENLDGGRVEEKEIKLQIPPGYGLQAMDLCEGVFGGYFPCLRKRSNLQGSADQSNSSNSNTIGSGNSEFFSGDCWNTTVDYLFGDPDPYARALPDPIYGYHRYYPQQPISGQIDYGEDHSWMDNSSYYNYECNGGGY